MPFGHTLLGPYHTRSVLQQGSSSPSWLSVCNVWTVHQDQGAFGANRTGQTPDSASHLPAFFFWRSPCRSTPPLLNLPKTDRRPIFFSPLRRLVIAFLFCLRVFVTVACTYDCHGLRLRGRWAGTGRDRSRNVKIESASAGLRLPKILPSMQNSNTSGPASADVICTWSYARIRMWVCSNSVWNCAVWTLGYLVSADGQLHTLEQPTERNMYKEYPIPKLSFASKNLQASCPCLHSMSSHGPCSAMPTVQDPSSKTNLSTCLCKPVLAAIRGLRLRAPQLLGKLGFLDISGWLVAWHSSCCRATSRALALQPQK